MTTPVPLPFTTSGPAQSQWKAQFAFPTTDISTYVWELVLRVSAQDTSATPAAKITSAAATASGYFTVNTTAGTVLAVLSPTATAALTPGQTYSLALWSNVGLSDENCWVRGSFTVLPVAAP